MDQVLVSRMVRIDSDESDPDEIDRVARAPDPVREGWEQTIKDVRAMMADREEDGYDTLMLPAGDTTPKNPETGDSEEWGLSYIIPGNKVEPLLEFIERGTFDETAVYQETSEGTVFIATECIDITEKHSLFVVGAYRMRIAPPLVRTAMEKNKMYTHIKKLDGTKLTTLEHNHPESFFPDPEEFYTFESEGNSE